MKLLFLGDFFYDYDHISEDMEDIINFINQSGYKVVVNLETALIDNDTPIKKRGPSLKSNPCILEILKRMNCLCVCLANNHTMDFGPETLSKTIENLEEEHIQYVGAGHNLDEACKPLVLDVDGKIVIIQNFGWNVEETVYATETTTGCSPLISQLVISQTEDVRKENPDAILVNVFHWGFEFNTLPMPRDIKLAHDCIDFGADAIIGHHPHVMQPFENYKNKPIYYSLGNFYFASRRAMQLTEFPNEKHLNMCDYGLGVVFDTESLETSNISIIYDRTNKRSIIQEENRDLNDITGIAWDSPDYIEQARLHSVNYNPILGLDEKENEKLINQLYRKYFWADRIRFIRKIPLGEKIYSILKHKMKR